MSRRITTINTDLKILKQTANKKLRNLEYHHKNLFYLRDKKIAIANVGKQFYPHR